MNIALIHVDISFESDIYKNLRLLLVNMPRSCVNSSDNFCYVCGEVTFLSQKHTLTLVIQKTYYYYLGCKIGDQGGGVLPC